MGNIKYIYSTDKNYWQEGQIQNIEYEDTLEITNEKKQTVWHYFIHNVESYVYWNMVLPKGGVSTWGWEQNTMITIEPETKEVVYEPEFYIMKHFSHFVKPGAKRIVTKGHWTSNSVVFENPDGEIVVIAGNAMDNEREFTFNHNGKSFSTIIKAHSINTFCVKE